MVRIRLARAGGKKKPFYRIVATDQRSPRDGRFIEQLGTYDPRKDSIRLDLGRAQHWISHGAIASQTVGQILKRARAAEPASA